VTSSQETRPAQPRAPMGLPIQTLYPQPWSPTIPARAWSSVCDVLRVRSTSAESEMLAPEQSSLCREHASSIVLVLAVEKRVMLGVNPTGISPLLSRLLSFRVDPAMNATSSRRRQVKGPMNRCPFPRDEPRLPCTNDMNPSVHTVVDDIRSCLLGATTADRSRDGPAD